MYLLDTDHMSLLQRRGPAGRRIEVRLAQVPPGEIVVSIISYEEQLRGWLAEIAHTRSLADQEIRYGELNNMLSIYCGNPIAQFDKPAIDEFQKLWLSRIRLGTMDLKIASIALSLNAVLVTRNSTDFGKIPRLRIEDWSV